MQTSTWKKERDALENIYGLVNETTHSTANSCKDDEYYCEKDKVCKKKDDKIEEDAVAEPMAPEAGVDAGMEAPAGDIPGEHPEVAPEPDEVDAEIASLKDLILNPDPGRVEEYASTGRLGDYIDMLKKKLDAALAVKSVIRGDGD